MPFRSSGSSLNSTDIKYKASTNCCCPTFLNVPSWYITSITYPLDYWKSYIVILLLGSCCHLWVFWGLSLCLLFLSTPSKRESLTYDKHHKNAIFFEWEWSWPLWQNIHVAVLKPGLRYVTVVLRLISETLSGIAISSYYPLAW